MYQLVMLKLCSNLKRSNIFIYENSVLINYIYIKQYMLTNTTSIKKINRFKKMFFKNIFCVFIILAKCALLTVVYFRLLICAPTNAAVDLLLSKLVDTKLFDKVVMKRIISYSHYISNSYNKYYDEYCILPTFDNSKTVPEGKKIGIVK